MTNVILLKMVQLKNHPAVWHETSLPNYITLKSLSRTIQKAFALDDDGVIEYEVLGCRAPGCRGRLRDLIASKVNRFRYLQSGAQEQCIEIVIVHPPRTNPERSNTGSPGQPHRFVR